MDGVIASNMRAYGLEYKLNFGVTIPRIREIASRYTPNKVLAEKLWQENTRELKILATLLYPKDEFTIETARRWIREIPNQEIREQMGFNLFKYLPYNYSLGMECVCDEDVDVRTTGYWFLGRHIGVHGLSDEADYNKMPYLWDDLRAENLSLHNAVKLLLKSTGRHSAMKANEILKRLIAFKDSEEPMMKEAYWSLVFDFQLYFGDTIIQTELV